MTRPQFSADLVTFTEETLNGNFHTLSSITTLRCSQDLCKHLRSGAFNVNCCCKSRHLRCLRAPGFAFAADNLVEEAKIMNDHSNYFLSLRFLLIDSYVCFITLRLRFYSCFLCRNHFKNFFFQKPLLAIVPQFKGNSTVNYILIT